MIFSNLNSNCSKLFDMKNLQEQVKKAFCYQKLFWPFTVWTNFSSDFKIFAKIQIFLTVGQSNFGNKFKYHYHCFAKFLLQGIVNLQRIHEWSRYESLMFHSSVDSKIGLSSQYIYIYIRTIGSRPWSSLNDSLLIAYGSLDFCPRPARKETNVPVKKRI
jgi:hypothetical protein